MIGCQCKHAKPETTKEWMQSTAIPNNAGKLKLQLYIVIEDVEPISNQHMVLFGRNGVTVA